MRNILMILKKELDKIFKDPRTIFTTIIMPGLLIFVVYGAMGMIMNDQVNETTEHRSRVDIAYSTRAIEEWLYDYDYFLINKVDNPNEDRLDEYLTDLVVVFDDKFNSASYNNKSVIKIYYNEAVDNSYKAYLRMTSALDEYKQSILVEEYNQINIYTFDIENKASDDALAGKSLAMLIPMLVIMFVISGALGVCSDSFAGEKERGTLATLFMTPTRKTDIVIGKIIANTIIALLAALSSFIGIMGSLPAMLGTSSVTYGFGDYVMLLLIILSVALVVVSLLSAISAVSKNTKEASIMSMPVYIIGMLAALIPGFKSGMPSDVASYFIPIYNCANGIKGILTFELAATQFTVIVLSNVIYFVIITVVLARLFKKESILFGR